MDTASFDGCGILHVCFLSLDLSNQERDYFERKEDSLGSSVGGLTVIFENLEDFFWMEGLGPFVLGAYFITFVVLLINLLSPMIREKRLRFELRNENNELRSDARFEE